MASKLFQLLCSSVAVMTATSGVCAERDRDRSAACPPSAQQFEQGYGLQENKYAAGYNAPASIKTTGWDFGINASFIYWHVAQDQMDLATNETTATANDVPLAVTYQDFKYKPGFKFGAALNTNYDGWVASLDYTWLHQTTTVNSTLPSTQDWLYNDWFINPSASTTAQVLGSMWKMYMDSLDLKFSRPYYEGKQLTVSPFGGLRALWIRQTMNLNLGTVADPLATYSRNQSNSWAIGPEAGFSGHWLVGSGFRFEGTTGASVLYTRYTKISHRESNGTDDEFIVQTRNYGTVRPAATMGLGLGWGSYLYNQDFHLDFALRYDFTYLWSQNMMRSFANQAAGVSGPVGDLNLHGLTIDAKFDF